MKGERKGWKFIYGLKDELTARAEETVIYGLKDVARGRKESNFRLWLERLMKKGTWTVVRGLEYIA